MNILQLSCAEEITCSFITLDLRAGRGSRGWKRMDGAPEGDPPSGRHEAGVHSCGPGSSSPNSLQNPFSAGQYLMVPLSGGTLAFAPSETLQAATSHTIWDHFFPNHNTWHGLFKYFDGTEQYSNFLHQLDSNPPPLYSGPPKYTSTP